MGQSEQGNLDRRHFHPGQKRAGQNQDPQAGQTRDKDRRGGRRAGRSPVRRRDSHWRRDHRRHTRLIFHKGLGLSKDDLARIDGELSGGKAAVCILAKPKEVEELTARLAKLGGQPETHKVTDDALEEAVTAAKATPEESPAEEPAGAPVRKSPDRKNPWRL